MATLCGNAHQGQIYGGEGNIEFPQLKKKKENPSFQLPLFEIVSNQRKEKYK